MILVAPSAQAEWPGLRSFCYVVIVTSIAAATTRQATWRPHVPILSGWHSHSDKQVRLLKSAPNAEHAADHQRDVNAWYRWSRSSRESPATAHPRADQAWSPLQPIIPMVSTWSNRQSYKAWWKARYLPDPRVTPGAMSIPHRAFGVSVLASLQNPVRIRVHARWLQSSQGGFLYIYRKLQATVDYS